MFNKHFGTDRGYFSGTISPEAATQADTFLAASPDGGNSVSLSGGESSGAGDAGASSGGEGGGLGENLSLKEATSDFAADGYLIHNVSDYAKKLP